MKITAPQPRRALAALLPTLLLASPAVAQQVQSTTTPPPVVQAAPPTVTPAPAPDPVSAPAPVADPVPTQTVAPPRVVPTVTAPRVPAPVARRAAPRPAPIAPRAIARPAPVAVAPAPEPVPAPAPVAAPAPEAPPEAPAAEAPVAPVVEPAPATTQTTTTSSTAIWPWVVGGVLVLVALFALLMGRRRRTEDAVEDTDVEDRVRADPAYADAPVAAAPILNPLAADPAIVAEPQFLTPAPAIVAVADVVDAEPAPAPAEHTEVVDADPAEVDALTAGTPPVAGRPWIEFAMRPVRAGTKAEDALVEIELTVGNSGSVAAEDVRVATFLFASAPADDAELERLLAERGDAGRSEPMTIAAGEGTRIDATLALPRADLGESFNPVVVADARYRLADGSEGRTCASFAIGLAGDGDELAPIENDRREMHHDVEARLEGEPEHA